MFQLIQLSNHSYIYRGFTLIVLPKKAMQPVMRYHVKHGDQSFGKFDAQVKAINYIDYLFMQRGG